MRFLMLMHPMIDDTEWTEGPTADAAESMNAYNKELEKAGVLLELAGLHPQAEGARVHFSGGSPSVTDGPFAEAKEVVGGYWIIQAKDKAEAVEWARRVPTLEGRDFMVEVRRIFEVEDFPQAIQDASTVWQEQTTG
jgi:hypothetical protein